MINVDSPTLEDNTTTFVQSETVLRRETHVDVKKKHNKQVRRLKGGVRPQGFQGLVFFFSFLHSGAQNLFLGLNCRTISCNISEKIEPSRGVEGEEGTH